MHVTQSLHVIAALATRPRSHHQLSPPTPLGVELVVWYSIKQDDTWQTVLENPPQPRSHLISVAAGGHGLSQCGGVVQVRSMKRPNVPQAVEWVVCRLRGRLSCVGLHGRRHPARPPPTPFQRMMGVCIHQCVRSVRQRQQRTDRKRHSRERRTVQAAGTCGRSASSASHPGRSATMASALPGARCPVPWPPAYLPRGTLRPHLPPAYHKRLLPTASTCGMLHV